MARQLIGSGSTFEAQMAYSRAVVDGDWVFVSGTTGFDYATMTIAPDVVAQCELCFRNIAAALALAHFLDGIERKHAPQPLLQRELQHLALQLL